MYKFQKFENRNARLENRISVTRSNSIGFPTQFYRNNNIKQFKYVVLYYDQDKKAIGIRFTNNEEDGNKFSIIHSKKGFGGSAVIRSFFRTYNINLKKYYGKYEWKKRAPEGIGELFVIDLKEREIQNKVS